MVVHYATEPCCHDRRDDACHSPRRLRRIPARSSSRHAWMSAWRSSRAPGIVARGRMPMNRPWRELGLTSAMAVRQPRRRRGGPEQLASISVLLLGVAAAGLARSRLRHDVASSA
jgi:hypothetical protein